MNNSPPKKKLRQIPEGFVYSEEAKRDLRLRAKKAARQLKALCQKSPDLKKRVKRLLKMANSK